MPKERRRWVQFSLRTILVVTAIVAIFLGITIHRARARRDAIRAIDERGGTYGVYITGPAWLRRLAGDEKYFYDAARVSFGPSNQGYDPKRPFTNDELEQMIDHINAFPPFIDLDLSSPHITDDGLRHLSGLRNIEGLWLKRAKITDDAIEHLVQLTTLKELHFWGTEITEEGIARLQEALPNCTIDKQ